MSQATFQGASLADAKTWVQTNLANGVSCPCCDQYCRIYKRKLNATMSLALVLIYRHFQQYPQADQWIHVPAFLVAVKHDSTVAGGDAAKLRFWNVIEQRQGVRDDGSERVGYYRLTDTGRQFVEDKIALSRYVYLYNQEVLRFSQETITIREALGDRFSYAELMRSK